MSCCFFYFQRELLVSYRDIEYHTIDIQSMLILCIPP